MRLKDGASLDRRRCRSSRRAASGSTSRSASAAIPRGRIIEIYGPESSGKTTLTLHAIAQVQKTGGVAAFIDAEHALDPTYARKLGVKTDELLVSQPDYGEQALEIADMLVRFERGRHHRDRLGRRARAEGRDRGRHGRQPRRPAGAADEPGAPQAHRHGRALQLPARLHQPDPHEDRRHVRQPGDDDGRQRAQVLREPSGSTSAASAPSRRPRPPAARTRPSSATARASRSSRTSWPRRSARSSSTSSTARASRARATSLDLGSELGIVEKSGAWFSFGGDRIGQGRENAKAYLEQHPEVHRQGRGADPCQARASSAARRSGRPAERRRRGQRPLGRETQARHGPQARELARPAASCRSG